MMGMMGTGVVRRGVLLALLIVALTGCRPANSASSSPAATSTVSPTASPTPYPIPTPRPATADELSAMIGAGRAPAEAELALKDWSQCSDHQNCLKVDDPPTGIMGIDAGDFHAAEGCPDGCGGAGCWVFLDRDQAGWHYVNARCAQATGSIPGPQDLVRVSGCANVRDRPGSSGKVLACLPDQTVVDVDSAPVFVDMKIWWHLKDRGWMAHDFLVSPKATA
jgi:hypothetical protein